MNNVVSEALATLRRECTRIEDKKQRESLQAKIKKLSAAFEEVDESKTVNPPGKAVIRDKNGKVVGLQG